MTPSQTRLAFIVQQTADVFELTPADVTRPGRLRRPFEARAVVSTIALATTRLSSVELGRLLGGRDHSSVLSAVKRAKYLTATDVDFAWRANEVWRRCTVTP